ncbi:MAG: hypothetical protein JHC26_01345 [Thermofilum sp.]|jgi:hypothetical protein|uniref:hypothetical protein n=1 Tax=Thermofilum sp. TaxID=1961369 RepID=UPI00258BF584|nr:hypothetical protein [Thermofilum sp.]MCI4407705.1 hypothetical protein [Thermofilum sp.]
MSVKLVDKEAGERLYQYIAGKLDALPQELRDKEKLLKALVYIQRTYGLTPQQVMEKLKERKSVATKTNTAEIGGKALERLVDVLKTLNDKYDIHSPTLRLTRSGLSIVGLSNDRQVAVSTELGFRAGEGYVAPPSDLIVYVDMYFFPEEDSPEKIIVRDDGVYVVENNGERKLGNIVEPDRALIIDSLERNMENKENRLDIEAKPEVLQTIRRLLASNVEPQLFFVKEGGKPAMYIGVFGKSPDNRFILRVPDSLITKAYVDPNAPDGALAYFSHSIKKKRLPVTSENAMFTTKVYPKDSHTVFPLRIVAKDGDGILYHVYYAPGDPEEAFFKPPGELLVTYPVNNDVVPNIMTDMLVNAYSVYLLPEKDKIYFVGTRYDEGDVIYLVELNTSAKIIDQASLNNVFKLTDAHAGLEGILSKAYKTAKTLGLQPSIDINKGNELSLFGVTGFIEKTEDEKAKTIKEKIEMLKELPEKYPYITLTGRDLIDILEKFNKEEESEDPYVGYDVLRINAKEGGVAELEACRENDNNKKVLWRKEIKISNPQNTPFNLKLYVENLARSGRLPLVERSWKGFYNTKELSSLLKNATIDIFFQPNGLPLFTRTRIGNITIYRSLE